MKRYISVFLTLLTLLSCFALTANADTEPGVTVTAAPAGETAQYSVPGLSVSLYTDPEYYTRFKDDNLTINVFNWGQYISEGDEGSIDVNAEFEELTGIHVNYSTFESNETMYTKLATGGVSFDIIVPSDYMVGRLIAENMVQKIDMANVPNAALVDPVQLEGSRGYDPTGEYSVPYTFGNVGVIYNTKYVEGTPDSWDILWDEKYDGYILMFDNPRDAYAIAEYSLGYSVNTEDKEEITACSELLAKQKPLVQQYVMDQIYDKMESEEAYVAPYYAGDYLQMKRENPDLAFFYPKEGFNTFIDAFCIPTSAKNKEAAEIYINFLCEPEVSAANLGYIGYSSPITPAKETLMAELPEDEREIAYPTVSGGTAFNYLSAEATEFMSAEWNEVRSAAAAPWGIIIAVAVIAVALVVFFIFRAKKKKKRAAARGE